MIASLLLQAAAGGGGIPTIVMFVGMFAIAYFFMFVPNEKTEKSEEFRDAVKGDQVVTIGGLHGKIVSVSEKTVVLEFESGKARVDKAALSPSGTSEFQEIEAKA